MYNSEKEIAGMAEERRAQRQRDYMYMGMCHCREAGRKLNFNLCNRTDLESK